MLTSIFGTLCIAYVLGSIPFGLLLTRMAGLGDIRQTGSGNIGATNVMRTGRKSLGIITLLLDGGKGAFAVWVCTTLFNDSICALAGLAAILGHIFPVWLKFKGGKGVATTIGVLMMINWLLGLAVCALWLIVFAATRTSSISSLMAIGYSAIIAYVVDDYVTALLCLNLGALIVFTHRSNIQRLLRGDEHRFREAS